MQCDLLIILLVINDFILRMGRDKVRLAREKQIVADDLEMGGAEEFVVLDGIDLGKERYLLIVEAKGSSLGAGGVTRNQNGNTTHSASMADITTSIA